MALFRAVRQAVVSSLLCFGEDSFTTLFNIRQVHENGGTPMASSLLINLINKVIKVWFILLTKLIAKDLQVLPIFWWKECPGSNSLLNSSNYVILSLIEEHARTRPDFAFYTFTRLIINHH
uniref:Uncharacterized protein n=1 Tax=Opuntia streptacantha TaxID=393608 RepID=A0A7C9DQ84_OPUST